MRHILTSPTIQVTKSAMRMAITAELNGLLGSPFIVEIQENKIINLMHSITLR
jgi:hypothetical protein